MKLFNSLGKRLAIFDPDKGRPVTVFTCGPSIYQQAHIGNFRTFLFEDVLVRYLEFKGYRVLRGMNFTDIEEKAIVEAQTKKRDLQALTEENIAGFMQEMRLLRMKMPDYLPKASDYVVEAVAIIQRLLELGLAYRHKKNIYFDPLQVPDFGKLYGLDMAQWPTRKRRYHRDTYPGTQWNLGDFILWHGAAEAGNGASWDTAIGRGRPSWNIQDPAMIAPHYHEPLSIYCGGTDNLYRHHDYTLAIMEAIRDYPLAQFWLHCRHLMVDGRKMSKSKGNVYYTETLLAAGYNACEIRFFLIYGHYREKLDYSTAAMGRASAKLRAFRQIVSAIKDKAADAAVDDCRLAGQIKNAFAASMDDDLQLNKAIDALHATLAALDLTALSAGQAAAMVSTLVEIDEVLQVLF
ncbi:MAG: class I tRNA ligase family protein [Syntrophales bacterium]